jgi:hypothetical protein
MILFSERATYINVFHAEFKPTISVQKIGKIRMDHRTWLRRHWIVRFMGRNAEYFSDVLNGSEKRQIIGMLDKLNSITDRSLSDSARRWDEIIGTAISDQQYRIMLRLQD